LLELVPLVLKEGPANFTPKTPTPEIVNAVLKKAYQSYA